MQRIMIAWAMVFCVFLGTVSVQAARQTRSRSQSHEQGSSRLRPRDALNRLLRDIRKGKLELTKEHCKKDPRLLRWEDINGERPLSHAAFYGRIATVQFLLASCGNAENAMSIYVNKANKYGETALGAAVKGANGEMVDLLLARRANPNIPSNDLRTPLMLAVVAPTDALSKVHSLLQAKAVVDARDIHGNTALLWTFCRHDADAFYIRQALIMAGADLTHANHGGMSAWLQMSNEPSTEVGVGSRVEAHLAAAVARKRSGTPIQAPVPVRPLGICSFVGR